MALLISTLATAAASPVHPGGGAVIESEDGRFGVKIQSRIQLLETVQSVDNGPVQQGFNLRRARLKVSGWGFGRSNRWLMQLGLSDSDRDSPGGSPLLDAYWEYAPDAPVRLVVGQYKIPISRARIGSSAGLQFVDRHSLDSEFALGRDRGATAVAEGWSPYGEEARVVGILGIFQGSGRATGLIQGNSATPMARVELMPLGAFDFHEDGDLERSEQLRIGLGAGVARAIQAPRSRGGVGSEPADGGTTNMTVYAFDLGLRWQGFSFEASVAGRKGERKTKDVPPSAIEAPRNGTGWVVQGGAMLPRVPVGVAGRYTSIVPSGRSSLLPSQELGGAVSWWIAGHPYDLTADLVRLSIGDETTLRGRLQLELSL